jgi:hypothetical protein
LERIGHPTDFSDEAIKMAVAAVMPGAAFDYSKAQVLFDIPVGYRGVGGPFRKFESQPMASAS